MTDLSQYIEGLCVMLDQLGMRDAPMVVHARKAAKAAGGQGSLPLPVPGDPGRLERLEAACRAAHGPGPFWQSQLGRVEIREMLGLASTDELREHRRQAEALRDEALGQPRKRTA